MDILIAISVPHKVFHLVFEITALADGVPMSATELTEPAFIRLWAGLATGVIGYKRPRPSIFSYSYSIKIFNGVYCL